MFEKIRKMKNQKGFTLVELIVVLVILAILAAMLVPALTGYIDKANNQKNIATTRQVVMAAQTEISEVYSKDKLVNDTITITHDAVAANPATDKITGKSIVELAEVGTIGEAADAKYSLKNGIESIVIKYDKSNGHVKEVVLTQGAKTCTYKEGEAESYNVTPKQ